MEDGADEFGGWWYCADGFVPGRAGGEAFCGEELGGVFVDACGGVVEAAHGGLGGLGVREGQWWVCGFADGCSYKVSSWYAPEMLEPSKQ